MTEDKGIFIKNIYYMLSYAFQVLKSSNTYENISGENFDNIENLFAAILSKGISLQIKQGLYRTYVKEQEQLPLLRGKLNLPGTIKNLVQQKRVLTCEFDSLSENNLYNQILKTTSSLLLNSNQVTSKYRLALKKILERLYSVSEINPMLIRWDQLKYQRNNQNYRMLMNLCYFVLNGQIATTEEGKFKLLSFSDEHMNRLYERFVLEYFKSKYPELKPEAPYINWCLDDSDSDCGIEFLPTMKSDIVLHCGDNTLIIDAKYYGSVFRTHYEKQQLHSGNLYQIFTYVKNLDPQSTGKVSGLLLYAKTGEALSPDFSYSMHKNNIGVKSLDLNTEFNNIAQQLNEIADSFKNLP